MLANSLCLFAVIILLTVHAQALITDCRGVAAGTACDDENLCTLNTICDGAGHCYGGMAVDCSHLTTSASPCVYGNCEPLQGCIVKAYSENTPCDTNANLCDIERCDGNGVCHNYHIAVTCANSSEVCQPNSGQCVEAPSASHTRSGSLTNSPTHSPSVSASIAPSASSQPPLVTPSPTNFIHFFPASSQSTHSASISVTRSPSHSTHYNASGASNSSLTQRGNATHSGSSSSANTGHHIALIIVPSVVACCLFAVLMAVLAFAVGASTRSLEKMSARGLSAWHFVRRLCLCSCFRRGRKSTTPYGTVNGEYEPQHDAEGIPLDDYMKKVSDDLDQALQAIHDALPADGSTVDTTSIIDSTIAPSTAGVDQASPPLDVSSVNGSVTQ